MIDRRSDRSAALAAVALSLLALPGGGLAQDGTDGLFRDEAARPTGAEPSEASEGALFLLLPVGAQGIAMGRAMTALSTQESAFWNPAGLAEVQEGRFLLFRGTGLAGEQTAFTMMFARPRVGTLAVSYQLFDVGSQPLTDRDNNVLGEVTVRSHLAVASFATEIQNRLGAGFNFKMVQFRVGCRGQCTDGGVTATTYAIDAGVQLMPTRRLPLRLGAMIAHLGPRLQVVNADQSDPLPTRLRVSGAYEMLGHVTPSDDLSLWVTFEVEDRWRHLGDPSLYVGTEFAAGTAQMVFVRAGYVHGELDQSDGAAIGLGLRYESFDLGIARSLADSGLSPDTEPFHFTLGYVF